MQGIMHLYIENAAIYVKNRLTSTRTSTISRTEFELRILTQLDLSSLDTEYKLAWMSAILNGDMFESFWVSQKYTHTLSDPQTQRYRTDQSLCSYIPPPIPMPKTLASPKSISLKGPPVHRRRSSSHDPYNKADAKEGFAELITIDLGPAEIPGSRKRKMTAEAIAKGKDEWETIAKGKKKASTAYKKRRMSTPTATQVSMPLVTEMSTLAVMGQDGQGAEKDGLDAVGDVQGVCAL